MRRPCRGTSAAGPRTRAQTAEQTLPHRGRKAVPFSLLPSRATVLGDEPADRHARVIVDQRQHGLRVGTAHQIDIDAVWTGGGQNCGKRLRAMLHGGVEAELICHEPAFGGASPQCPPPMASRPEYAVRPGIPRTPPSRPPAATNRRRSLPELGAGTHRGQHRQSVDGEPHRQAHEQGGERPGEEKSDPAAAQGNGDAKQAAGERPEQPPRTL